MNLRRRIILIGLLTSLPLAYVVTAWVGSMRFNDMAVTLEQFGAPAAQRPES